MGKREKILVFLMIAAIAFGAYELFLSSPVGRNRPAPGPAPRTASEIAGTIAKQAQEAELDRPRQYVLELAAMPWENNPFYLRPEAREKGLQTPGGQKKEPSFTYTGYLEIGDRRMAIINGLEYAAGDEIENEAAIVHSITPRHVVIDLKETGRKITVPYSRQKTEEKAPSEAG